MRAAMETYGTVIKRTANVIWRGVAFVTFTWPSRKFSQLSLFLLSRMNPDRMNKHGNRLWIAYIVVYVPVAILFGIWPALVWTGLYLGMIFGSLYGFFMGLEQGSEITMEIVREQTSEIRAQQSKAHLN